jgi:hypothetical protein
MHDGHLVPAAEKFVQLAQQAGTDDHRVGRVDGHLDGDRSTGGGHVAAPAGACNRETM